MKRLQKQMADLEGYDKLGRWEIENRDRTRVARNYFMAKSNKHKKQFPRAPQSHQVEIQANDLPSCQVSFLIDEDDQKCALSIPPKTAIITWSSWGSINIQKLSLKKCRRCANVVR